MIIGVNYSDDGERYIAYMQYVYEWNNERIRARADYLLAFHDEVYVMAFNCNCKELIEEVVLKGCRI